MQAGLAEILRIIRQTLKTTRTLWDMSAGAIRERNNKPADGPQKTPAGLNLYVETVSGSLPGKGIISSIRLLSAVTTVKLFYLSLCLFLIFVYPKEQGEDVS